MYDVLAFSFKMPMASDPTSMTSCTIFCASVCLALIILRYAVMYFQNCLDWTPMLVVSFSSMGSFSCRAHSQGTSLLSWSARASQGKHLQLQFLLAKTLLPHFTGVMQRPRPCAPGTIPVLFFVFLVKGCDSSQFSLSFIFNFQTLNNRVALSLKTCLTYALSTASDYNNYSHMTK